LIYHIQQRESERKMPMNSGSLSTKNSMDEMATAFV